jgi:transcriptional regulator with XRE-family HTH domain
MGLDQAEFAGMFGFRQNTISKWEKGRSVPPAQVIIRMLRFANKQEGSILLRELASLYGIDEGQFAYRHPDGHWVTLRKATPADVQAISEAVVAAHHQECETR